jgi:transcription elongation factor Elf1
MKLKQTQYGTEFNLHCPRCGFDEWSKKTFSTTKDWHYHKCMHCGADTRVDENCDIVMVIEPAYRESTPNTYHTIEKQLETDTEWTL